MKHAIKELSEGVNKKSDPKEIQLQMREEMQIWKKEMFAIKE